MTRRAWKCVPLKDGDERSGLDRTPDDFARSMGYGRRQYASREEFLAFHSGAWVRELSVVLRELLVKDRHVLSVGSGECEHELPFILEGYDILASDVVAEAAEITKRLFPALRFQQFDLRQPDRIGPFDDVLITGLDYLFDDEALDRLMGNARSLLRHGGRVLFVLRYRDNVATRVIDYVGTPAAFALLRMAGLAGLTRKRWMLKLHGFRRSPRDLVAIMRRHGFRLGRTRHAGFGSELTRLYLDRVVPPVYLALRGADRWLHWVNNAIVFEFLTELR